MKPGGGGHTLYGADKRGRGENKARNETPVLGSFKFNCLVPYDPKLVCFHRPMSHHKIRFQQIGLSKLLKFFFRIN